MKAVALLNSLQALIGETSDIYYYQNARIKGSSLRNALGLYAMGINKFLGNSLIKRLEGTAFSTIEEVRERLKPTSEVGEGEWIDLAGLILPKESLDNMVLEVENNQVDSLAILEGFFNVMHRNYYEMEWTWAYGKIEEYYHIDLDTISAAQIVDLVKQWQSSVISLDDLLYSDARKEFSLTSMTGFGVDGSDKEKLEDFEGVRGVFDSNPFVTAVKEHIITKRALGDELIGRMEDLIN